MRASASMLQASICSSRLVSRGTSAKRSSADARCSANLPMASSTMPSASRAAEQMAGLSSWLPISKPARASARAASRSLSGATVRQPSRARAIRKRASRRRSPAARASASPSSSSRSTCGRVRSSDMLPAQRVGTSTNFHRSLAITDCSRPALHGVLERQPVGLPGVAGALGHPQGVAHRLLGERPLGVGVGHRQRPRGLVHRGAVGVHAAGLGGGLQQARDRLAAHLLHAQAGGGRVVGGHRLPAGPIGLQVAGQPQVQAGAVAAGQRLVGHVADQRVLEAVAGAARAHHQVARDQLAQVPGRLVLRAPAPPAGRCRTSGRSPRPAAAAASRPPAAGRRGPRSPPARCPAPGRPQLPRRPWPGSPPGRRGCRRPA